MFKISLTPKTPEQILLAAVNSNNQVHTYTPEFSASATIGAGAMTIGSLDLKIQDPIDVTPKQQMAFDIMADIGVNYACTLYQATGSVRKKDSVLFGKIDQVSDSIIDTYGSFSYSSSDSSLSTDEIKKTFKRFVPIGLNTIYQVLIQSRAPCLIPVMVTSLLLILFGRKYKTCCPKKIYCPK